MILINEFLPNPTGSDTTGEWIELFNNGTSAQDITGWTLTSGAKGKFIFPKTTIQSGEYLVVSRKQSKLTLRNADETVSLYDKSGNLVDTSSYVGTAQEGKSFSRLGSETAGQNFIFTEPTPGAVNKITPISLIDNHYPAGVPLNSAIGGGEIVFLAVAAAAVVASLVLYAVIKNEYLNDIFFSKY